MASADRLIEVFTEAKARPAGAERERFLAEACPDDPELKQQVISLLRAHEGAGDFLKNSIPTPATLLTEKPGDWIGRYKLLEQIGEGGCGVVYMAEQEEPVRRRVALKVIKLGMDTKQVIARFEAERQALAMMDHPNIAKVLDGGATDTGRPFFVMELVRGIKITDYCDQNNLSTKERLELFMQVCQAIQHAHQKGIIHRDIKPSNILVTQHDDVAVPKIIDFGIAKATVGQLTDKTAFTAFAQFIGTPAYMSPEQAQMSGLDIDTRADIYSLGVLLYELLTGNTPFDAKELLAAGMDEMRRKIREDEPAKPSTCLSTMQAMDLTTVARRRHVEPPKLIHLIRGDLDWLVMKCLEKDRTRRYETANGLAMDVQRHLKNEPVVARPPSILYRFQKLVRRNKLAFGAAGAVAAALLIGLTASTSEYLNERKARQRETAVSQLLEQLLSSADPDGLKGSDYTVRELLDDFTAGLTNRFGGQREVEATVRLTIGSTYARLGVFAEGESNLRQAVELRRGALGSRHLDTLEAQQVLAKFLVGSERKWEEGATLSFDTWQARRRRLGAEHRDTLRSQETYAAALMEGGRAQEAERIEREVLQIRQRVLGPDDYDTIDAFGTLGQTLMYVGARAEAESNYRKSLAGLQRLGYAEKLDGIICAKELAVSRLEQGDAAEAVRLLEKVRPRAIKRLGPHHPLTFHIQRVLARALAEEGRLDEAEALCKETLDARLHSNANQEPYGTARTQLTLGRVLVEKNKPDEAELVLQEALKVFRDETWSKPRPYLAAQAANWLGAIQLGRKAYPQAETLLLSGSEQFFAPTADMTPNERRLAVGHIVQLYQAWGKPEQVAVWQKKLEQLDKPLANNPR